MIQMNMPTFTMPSSINCTPIEQRLESRTPQQFEAVKAIVESPDFHFACSYRNLFDAEVGSYTGPFMFLYYTKDGSMHGKRISKNGKILASASVKSDRH